MKTIVLALLAMATAACSRANVLPSADGKAFSLLAETDPVAVSRRLTDQFLRTRPENYCPPGYRGNGYCDDGYGGGKHVQYAVVSIWANALECARQAGDTAREDRLIRLYDDFLPGGSKHAVCPRPYHVDDAIFGSLALQIYLRTKDPRHLAEGLRYADAQWTPPCDATVKERHAASMELQEEYWKAGYTPQTRLWIDDMYMITALQSQAYRATGDRKYIERAAKEMCLYLDRLQLKGGPASGLFYHAPDVPLVWGRGDGWMAAGMAMTLKYLPADSEWRERILSGYVAMMEALLKFQRPDGMWCQLVNEPDADGNWPESSCTAMFAYAFIVGVKNGWLEAERFGKPAQKAWIALCRRLDENANVPDVCCGTGKFNDRSYYFNRIRVHGDPHGQAPLLWCAAELIGSPISGDAARAHDIDLKPTFTSCGVEYPSSSPVPGIQLECRRAMSGWTAVDGAEFPYFKSDGVYRGSLRNLDENTSYAVRITSRGKVLAEGKFRTWKSDVPVARTVELAADGHLPKIVSETGASGGWVRIVAKDGGVLDFGECAETPIVVDGAKYVVFDGLRIRGSRARNVFKISNSRFVRIRNCDISHWGRIGEPRFDKFGRFFEADDESDWGINFDGAIEIGKGAFGCVVERCWIHDPRGRANSWFYSHPAGPEAVVVNRPKGSTVIRWNDFTSSDLHRYNDAVEGLGNFRLDGGFNRDADIYGNFMAFCNDDCIELDGGQRNVRCFGNRFEAALCGVSVQGCMKGPSYVSGNLFSGMCEEFGKSGQTLKTGSGEHGTDAVVFADGNVFWGAGDGIVFRDNLKVFLRDNIFCAKQSVLDGSASPLSVLSGNRLGVVLEEDCLDPGLPARPVGFVLARARFSGIRVSGGMATPRAVSVVVRGGAHDTSFTVAKGDGMDWFDVSPAFGLASAGGEVELTVAFKPEKMKNRRHFRGCFLVRTEAGLSRPVTLYAETDYTPPYRVEHAGDLAIYHPAFSEGAWMPLGAKDAPGEFSFDVPRDGRYYFMVRTKGSLALKVAVDDDRPEVSRQQNEDYPTWTMLTLGRVFGNMLRHYDLKAGRHVVRIWPESGRPLAEGLVLTDNPLPFEPR